MKSQILQHKSTVHLIENIKEELSEIGYKSGSILIS